MDEEKKLAVEDGTICCKIREVKNEKMIEDKMVEETIEGGNEEDKTIEETIESNREENEINVEPRQETEVMLIRKRKNRNKKSGGFKVYEETLKEFKSFCDDWSMIDPVDILSMALEDYMDKYKK